MNRLINIFLVALVLTGTVSQSCKKASDDTQPDLVADFHLSPQEGSTTTIFHFDLGTAIDLGDNSNPVFIRFDWDGDGDWDMMHSSMPEYDHRYYLPGDYTTILEVSRVSGETDTISQMISVEQGYSPPRALLMVQPDSAHLLTDFIFDGSQTQDDEDSIAMLKFRWDFDGDQVWDTDFISDPVMSHRFMNTGHITAIMEVKDTMGLVGRTELPLIVNRLNGLIKPRVNYTCNNCTVEDEFIFDASESFEENKPESRLLYSWNVLSSTDWEVDQSENPLFKVYLPDEGEVLVKLRVSAPDGLYMDTTLNVMVHPKNTPPYAYLDIGCQIGNPQTQFYFNSLRSYDRDESMMNLRIRWDLNMDGIWDTSLDDQSEVYHKYNEAGTYLVRMAIIDSQNKESIVTGTVTVFDGNHETGFVEDKRGTFNEYYGTVKIGDQWWMQENFNSEFKSKNFDVTKNCYSNNPDNCKLYGGLYSLYEVHLEKGLCPKGWRIPSVQDWQTLMNYLEKNQIRKLEYGGSSEFHINLAGYIDVYRGYMGLDKSTHFWTSDLSKNGVPIAWYFHPDKGINREVFVSKFYEFYVRCIKE